VLKSIFAKNKTGCDQTIRYVDMRRINKANHINVLLCFTFFFKNCSKNLSWNKSGNEAGIKTK